MKPRIYLDNNATTPTDTRVIDAMMPYYTEKFGNAASRNHSFGWEAEEAVENARKAIANELNCRSREIVFTSGATESVNLAIKGYCERDRQRGKHIVTQVTEHKAVLDTSSELEKRGWEVTYMPVRKDGLVDFDELTYVIREDTVLVSIMHANNEIGTVNDITAMGKLCRDRDVRFFVDAAQSFGKLDVDVDSMNIDMLAASGHKIYGPKGIGFLYVRQRNPKVELKLQVDGGGHERGMRSGTLPVPLIIGLAEATRLCAEERQSETERLKQMRDSLLEKVTSDLPDTIVNGSLEHRLPHNINFSFPDVEGEALLMELESIACSSGSACTSATLKPSYVMKALGHSEEVAHSSIRIAFGRMNRDEDGELAAKEIINAVRSLRGKSPFHRMKRV
ncbi:MAG: IscS subfamily cysteine desulfurase [Candidatus Marinimicrobia bacterium]|nr:IscS subfamily cysteine desulfurase [Candidatus Neomarinimicrobiota bacterium]|tara:strand:- start:4572 stop:5750 length:1179 start_codon:yes stop_codon:yes gene_type:complete